MHWECAQISQSEDGESFGAEDKSFSLQDIIGELKAEGDGLLWRRLIQMYTSRNMTYLSDKLPAFSGIITAIQQQTHDICYAGIWRKNFLAGLLWRLEDPASDMYVLTPKSPKRPENWRAPSWSFAAVEGVIRYEQLMKPYCAKIEECSVTPAGANPLGELSAGFIRISGPLIAIEKVASQKTSAGRTCLLQLRDQGLANATVFFDFENYEESTVLMLTPNSGLAVRLLDHRGSHYVRIGIVQVYGFPQVSASQLPESTSITLL
jgi:hypothetical protein